MKFILLSFLLIECSCHLHAQDIQIKLTLEQKEELKYNILSKVKELASLIDNLSSTNSLLNREKKLTEIDKGKYLFYEFDRRYIYLTSPRFPKGQKRNMRSYFHNLIMLSERYYFVKIEWSDFVIPMDSSIFKFVGYTKTGDVEYEGKAFFKQIFIEYKLDGFSNREIPTMVKVMENIDAKSVDIRVTITKSKIGNEWKNFYNIKLGDVHATLLEYR